jgi:hypothetical protein
MTFGVYDSSSYVHQITCNGAYADPTQAKFGGGSLKTVWGSTSQATIASGTEFNPGSGQFTVEAWVDWTSHVATNYEAILCQWQTNNANLGWWLGMFNTGALGFQWGTGTGTTASNINAAYTPTLNSFAHIAADRDASGVVRLYANGAVLASTTDTSTWFASTATVFLGDVGTSSVPGYIDEMRISNIARFGGAFTPPSSPYTPDANTVLLVHANRGALSINGNKASGSLGRQISSVPVGQASGLLKAPTPGPRTVSGLVTVTGTPTGGLIVVAYAEATHELIGTAITAANGTYSINCGANWQAVTVIAYDPVTYQAIAFDRVIPA